MQYHSSIPYVKDINLDTGPSTVGAIDVTSQKQPRKSDTATATAHLIIGGILVLIAILLYKCITDMASGTESEAESETREHLNEKEDVINRVIEDAKDAVNAVSGESLDQLDRVAAEAAAEVKGTESE